MGDHSRTRIVIIGAGKGGMALLELFVRLPHVEIVGIAEINPAAPGLHRAQDLGIPFSHDTEKLISNDTLNLIVDVTDDPSVQELIGRMKCPNVEVLGGARPNCSGTLSNMQLKYNQNYCSLKNWPPLARLSRGSLMISATRCI